MLALAEALDYAHSQGVVHRDIKPSNIMLRSVANKQQKFKLILLDFGRGKFLNSNSAISEHVPRGTLAYMAPEQIRVADDLDHRLDIYALGVICYQLFTGELPFPFTNPATLLFAHLYKPAPDPRLVNPNLDVHVAAAVLRALEKSPERRPQTALGVVREFVPISEEIL